MANQRYATAVHQSSIHVKIEPWSRPIDVRGNSATLQVRYPSIPFPLFKIHAIDFFIGQDNGDRCEVDLSVFSFDMYLAGVILEKENQGVSWRRPRVMLPIPQSVRNVDVHLTVNVTGQNNHSEFPSDKDVWRCRTDWHIILIGEKT